jgi:hypothetical protein
MVDRIEPVYIHRYIILKIDDNYILYIYSHLRIIHGFLLDDYISYRLRGPHSFNHMIIFMNKNIAKSDIKALNWTEVIF